MDSTGHYVTRPNRRSSMAYTGEDNMEDVDQDGDGLITQEEEEIFVMVPPRTCVLKQICSHSVQLYLKVKLRRVTVPLRYERFVQHSMKQEFFSVVWRSGKGCMPRSQRCQSRWQVSGQQGYGCPRFNAGA